MIDLLRGELLRVVSRRLVKVLALMAVLGSLAAGVLVFLNTDKIDAAGVETQRRTIQARFERCLQGETPTLNGRVVEGPPPGSGSRANFCEFAAGRVDDPRFKLRSLKGILQGTTAPLVIVAWLIGASVIGADWQSRTITTLLTWEPRRIRVLLTKAVACILVASVFALVAQALVSVALLPSAWWHGTTAGTGGDWLRSVFGVLARGTGLVAIAATIGFAVASVGRNTAAALGIGFAYFLVIENVVGSFLAGFRRWLVLGNAIVLVSGEDGGGDVAGRSVVAAAAYLTAVGLSLLAAAVILFQRRDVA